MCFQEYIAYQCGHRSLGVVRPCPLTTSGHNFPICTPQPTKQYFAETMCTACERQLHSRWVLIREWEHRWLHERGACGCQVKFPGLIYVPRVIGDTAPVVPGTPSVASFSTSYEAMGPSNDSVAERADPSVGDGESNQGDGDKTPVAGPSCAADGAKSASGDTVAAQAGPSVGDQKSNQGGDDKTPSAGSPFATDEVKSSSNDSVAGQAGTSVGDRDRRCYLGGDDIPPLFTEDVTASGETHLSVRQPGLYAAEWVADHRAVHDAGKCDCPADFTGYRPRITDEELTPGEMEVVRRWREHEATREAGREKGKSVSYDIGGQAGDSSQRIAEISRIFGTFTSQGIVAPNVNLPRRPVGSSVAGSPRVGSSGASSSGAGSQEVGKGVAEGKKPVRHGRTHSKGNQPPRANASAQQHLPTSQSQPTRAHTPSSSTSTRRACTPPARAATQHANVPTGPAATQQTYTPTGPAATATQQAYVPIGPAATQGTHTPPAGAATQQAYLPRAPAAAQGAYMSTAPAATQQAYMQTAPTAATQQAYVPMGPAATQQTFMSPATVPPSWQATVEYPAFHLPAFYHNPCDTTYFRAGFPVYPAHSSPATYANFIPTAAVNWAPRPQTVPGNSKVIQGPGPYRTQGLTYKNPPPAYLGLKDTGGDVHMVQMIMERDPTSTIRPYPLPICGLPVGAGPEGVSHMPSWLNCRLRGDTNSVVGGEEDDVKEKKAQGSGRLRQRSMST